MYKIVDKKILNEQITAMTVEAPFIAKKVQPGQFVIIRADEKGERVPLTVADFDREKGTVTVILQESAFPLKRFLLSTLGKALQIALVL